MNYSRQTQQNGELMLSVGENLSRYQAVFKLWDRHALGQF